MELGGGASDGEILIGIGNPVPKSGGLSRHFVANAITSYITTALQHPEIGLTTIHELMHAAISGFAGSDESFAYAAAEIADVKRPIFTPYDPSKPISATNRGVPYQASEYWGERLDQACGFSSHITHKFTNYKLYK